MNKKDLRLVATLLTRHCQVRYQIGSESFCNRKRYWNYRELAMWKSSSVLEEGQVIRWDKVSALCLKILGLDKIRVMCKRHVHVAVLKGAAETMEHLFCESQAPFWEAQVPQRDKANALCLKITDLEKIGVM